MNTIQVTILPILFNFKIINLYPLFLKLYDSTQ
jgi:hypothetical protein